MLSHIHIRQFAIVEQLDLDLAQGMTALTGETGAGKSILLDALGLALGDRAESGLIRSGAERAEIICSFDLSDAPLAQVWLCEQDLADDEECLIRRVINSDGRSRSFINGTPMPLQALRSLGEMLVDIHGQHAHQSLLRKDTQRQVLDEYAGNQADLQQLKTVTEQWQQTRDELDRLRQAARDRDARLELLSFQLSELQDLDLRPEALRELNEEHNRLAHAERLLSRCQEAVDGLYENDELSVQSQLTHILNNLTEAQSLDAGLTGVVEMINQALIQVEEAAGELRHYRDNLELDPQRLNEVEDHIARLHDLARKHRVEAGQLAQIREQLDEELAGLSDSDQRAGELQDQLERLRKDYQVCAQRVSQRRQQAAKRLGEQVSEQLSELGMKGARFAIELTPVAEDRLSAQGLESVEYQVCTNPGQPFAAMSKIASGGELSRISLALQVALADSTHIPTLIYDEVDSGIGGPTAEVVGRKLRKLGTQRQVLCVTHLPQVAAQAHHHCKVEKTTLKKTTQTAIRALDDTQRVEEVARMLGGVEQTEQSLAHAREMLERAEGVKKKPRKKRA